MARALTAVHPGNSAHIATELDTHKSAVKSKGDLSDNGILHDHRSTKCAALSAYDGSGDKSSSLLTRDVSLLAYGVSSGIPTPPVTVSSPVAATPPPVSTSKKKTF